MPRRRLAMTRAMSDIKCERCGGKLEGKNYFTYCSYKRDFIHVQCECVCEYFSQEMLPNGTHCKKRFSEENYKYRLLSHRISAPEDDVQGAVIKYESMSSDELYKKFVQMINVYKIIDRDDTDKRLLYRVELAAMQRILVRRELANPKLSLWARRFFVEEK